GGFFNTIGGLLRHDLAAVDPVTGLAMPWNAHVIAPAGTSTYVGDMAFRDDGTLLVTGSFIAIGGQTHRYISALDTATAVATSWDPRADAPVGSLAVSGNRVYVTGSFSTIGGQARDHAAALDAITGQAFPWFPPADTGPNSVAGAVAVSGGTVYM